MVEKVVHGLLAGKPLCRFTDKLPRDWPEGHVWTQYDDLTNMTCERCRTAAQEKAEMNKE